MLNQTTNEYHNANVKALFNDFATYVCTYRSPVDHICMTVNARQSPALNPAPFAKKCSDFTWKTENSAYPITFKIKHEPIKHISIF